MTAPKLTIEKTGSALVIHVEAGQPQLRREENGYSTLSFNAGEDALHIHLTPVNLQTLGLLCVAELPALSPQTTMVEIEYAYRQPARLLNALGSRSLQVVLREVQADTLVDFLWYVKDRELMRAVFANLAQRAGELLMDDISCRWRGINPDTAPAIQSARGRLAVEAVLGVTRRLAEEGQIALEAPL